GIDAPGDAVDGVVDHHVGRDDALVLTGALEVHVAPEVEQHRSMERVRRAFQKFGRRIHAVVDGLLEAVHPWLLSSEGATSANLTVWNASAMIAPEWPAPSSSPARSGARSGGRAPPRTPPTRRAAAPIPRRWRASRSRAARSGSATCLQAGPS